MDILTHFACFFIGGFFGVLTMAFLQMLGRQHDEMDRAERNL